MDSIINFLSCNLSWQLWLLVCFVLLILEIFTSGFLLGCFAVGAFASFLLSAIGFGASIQACAFFVFSILSLIYLRPFINRITKKKETLTGMDAIIGREVFVSDDIIPDKNKGYIKCDGDLWRAISSDRSNIEKGTKVRILSYEGIVVKVEKTN